MSSFFTLVDDQKNQRVFLYRAEKASEECIWLDADPTGAETIPMPPAAEKIDLGSATNKAGFVIPYKDGVKFSFATDLPATKEVVFNTPTDISVVVSGGVAPYKYSWTKGGIPFTADGATLHLTGAISDASIYRVTVTDVNGLVIVSTTMDVTIKSS